MKTKRRERLQAEHEASATYGHKAKEIVRGERKKDRLKREIDTMYYQLEHTYNNNKVTQLENDLQANKLQLLDLYHETQG